MSLAGPTPTPWPRMPSGQRNPFQNAPGLFIYALPNLAGTCPFAFSDTASDLVCPFADSAAAAPGRRHHNECYHHPAVASCCDQRHPASEFESQSESAESNAELESELDSPLPAQQQQQQQPLLPVDESHFDLGDIRSSSLSTEGYHDGAKFCTTQQKQRQQNQPERSSGPSTPTHSHTLSSPMGSEFTEAKDPENENEKEDGEEEGEEEEGKEKRKRRPRKRRRRTKGRLPSEEAGCVMGPRMMGLSGLHFDRWTRYVCPAPPPPPPPPPAAMKPHAWFVAPGFDAFVPRTGARFWDPPMAVQAVQVPGLVSVSCW